MTCHGTDIIHQHIHVGEDVGVHTLKNIIRSLGLCGFYKEGVIDQAFAEGLDFCDHATDGELVNNRKQFFVHKVIS